MKQHPVAGRYAEALLEVGQERGESETYEQELKALTSEVFNKPEFRIFFESPKIPRREKKAVLERALGGKVSPAVLNLLRVLIDRGRQMLFGEIVENFFALYDEARGRTTVRFTAARPLSAELRERLVQALHAKLAKEIIPEERVDEDLLGGMTIKIGDTVVDGSLRTKLNEIRETAASRRLGRELIHED